MSKEKTMNVSSSGATENGSWLSEMFHFGAYKPLQGKAVRQVTFASMVFALALSCYRLSLMLKTTQWSAAQYPLPLALLLIGGWICYRAVNIPKFADFLIAVQAEMNKVSWPSKQELIRSSMVVIFVIFLLATVLFGFDLFWMWAFRAIGVLKG